MSIFSALPKLTKLETLSISYMAPLKTIGKGALSALPALQTLICNNNPHLSYIHPNALSSKSEESSNEDAADVWPPITTVNTTK